MVMVLTMIYLLGLLPTAMASCQDQAAFPDIPLKVFVGFIEKHFSTEISLATVFSVAVAITTSAH
jgi:hypothetical protein